MSFRESRSQINSFSAKRQLTADLNRLHRRDRPLSVQARNVRIVPNNRASGENAPSHRVFVGRAEIGAAWSKTSNECRDYLGLKLDDPSFTAPIYANLVEAEDGESHNLIWSLPSRRNGE